MPCGSFSAAIRMLQLPLGSCIFTILLPRRFAINAYVPSGEILSPQGCMNVTPEPEDLDNETDLEDIASTLFHDLRRTPEFIRLGKEDTGY